MTSAQGARDLSDTMTAEEVNQERVVGENVRMPLVFRAQVGVGGATGFRIQICDEAGEGGKGDTAPGAGATVPTINAEERAMQLPGTGQDVGAREELKERDVSGGKRGADEGVDNRGRHEYVLGRAKEGGTAIRESTETAFNPAVNLVMARGQGCTNRILYDWQRGREDVRAPQGSPVTGEGSRGREDPVSGAAQGRVEDVRGSVTIRRMPESRRNGMVVSREE